MEPNGLHALLHEFCARHTDDPNLFQRPDNTAVCFNLGKQGCGPLFSLEVSARSVTFASGVDLAMTDAQQALVQELCDQLFDGVAFGRLYVNADGPQWGWSAPAMPYPYFNGIASHAIAYAEYPESAFGRSCNKSRRAKFRWLKAWSCCREAPNNAPATAPEFSSYPSGRSRRPGGVPLASVPIDAARCGCVAQDFLVATADRDDFFASRTLADATQSKNSRQFVPLASPTLSRHR